MAQSILQIIIQAVDKASGTLKKVGNEAKGMEKDFGKASSGINLDTATIVKGIASVGAAAIAAKKVWDFGYQGAQMDRLEIASSNLAASYGGNMREIVESIQSASFNTISYYDAMQSSSRAMMLGLGADTQQLSNLMEIAAFRGRAMGVNTTQAFNDIVTGIGRKSRLILDNLGIIINAEQAYEDYAAKIGVSKDELSAAAQVQAYMNAVLEEGNALMKQAGGLTMDSASAYERVGATIKDITMNMKKFVAEAILPAITNTDEYLEIQGKAADTALKTGQTYGEYHAAMFRSAKELGAYIDIQSGALYRWDGINKRIIDSNFMLTESQFQLEQMTRSWATNTKRGLSEVENATDKWADKIISYQGGVSSATEATEGLTNGMSAQIAMGLKLQDVMDKYSAAVAKAGDNTDAATDAFDKASDSIESMVFDMVASNLTLEENGQLIKDLGYELGQYTEAEYRAASAAQMIQKAHENNIITDTEYVELSKRLSEGLAEIMAGGKSSYYIDIYVRTHGAPLSSDFTVTPQRLGWNADRSGVDLAVRQFGGEVTPGQAYIVGERRPELFVPNMPGRIEPSVRGGMGGGSINISFQYAPMISTASRQEAIEVIAPLIEDVIKDRTRGRVL